MTGLGIGTIGVALAASGYQLAATLIAHRFTTARRVRPSSPPPAAEGETDFHCVRFPARDGKVTLSAWYCASRNARSAVVLVHGRNSCRGDELRGSTFVLARRLVDAGLSVLMVDLRGHGDSDHARLSFGHHERHDVLGAVDFLLSRGYVAGRIGVLGASMGGSSAISAAAAELAIGALVTDSAFADFGEVLRAQFRRLTKLPDVFLYAATRVGRRMIGIDLRHHSVVAAMTLLRNRPTLVIHADFDPFVPVSHAHALADAGASSLWITASNRHLGSFGATGEEYLHRVTAFFADHLSKNSRQ